MSDTGVYHIPVMLEECLEAMQISSDGIYLDVTMGGGGHTKAILQQLGSKGHLYSVDQDPDAEVNIPRDERFTFIASNFRHIDRFMDYYARLGQVDAILADLGVSSHHFDTAERGFSFRARDARLDMRMNTRQSLTAYDVVNSYEEQALARIFYDYGELRQSRQLASRLVCERAKRSITTIGDLLDSVASLISVKEEKKQLGMLFQALRIEVNDELGALREMLEATKRILKPGGRLVVLTYHSLEDRMVKNFFRSAQDNKIEQSIYGVVPSSWQVLTRKPLVPSKEEEVHNPRSRSAKLRVASWLGKEASNLP